jgi:hypothetical protein
LFSHGRFLAGAPATARVRLVFPLLPLPAESFGVSSQSSRVSIDAGGKIVKVIAALARLSS